MTCKTGSCHGKWCSWIQALAQIAVAGVIVYSGYIVNEHMESWTRSFERGSGDLHSIRLDMGNIAYSMESINTDMEAIKHRMDNMTGVGNDINNTMTNIDHHMYNMNANMQHLNQQVDYMNHTVGVMKRRLSPGGMFKNMMPF
jgi:methyl-accepting chemotaxis protein